MQVAIGKTTIAILGLLTIAGQLRPGQEPSAAVLSGEHRIAFHARNGLIYVPARVNGNRATLLLDTGAVLTTFNLRLVPKTDSGSRISINTANGTTTAYQVPVGFHLGEADVKDMRSFRQTVVVGDFRFGDADGVIGLDVLSSFKVITVDFQNSVLILQDR
jgi:predicted aspartyl protease